MELNISDQTIILRDPDLFLELGLVDNTLAVFQARPDHLSIVYGSHL